MQRLSLLTENFYLQAYWLHAQRFANGSRRSSTSVLLRTLLFALSKWIVAAVTRGVRKQSCQIFL